MTTSDGPESEAPAGTLGGAGVPVAVGPGAFGTGDDPGAGEPDQPGGNGPAGAGCGPYRCGASALMNDSQAAAKSSTPTPSAALNASSSVTPSAYERSSETSAARPWVFTRESAADT